ncbi:MAG: Clp protease N-terminal domain-containing protein, partial [Pirellulaceae bacterium]
MFERCTDRCRKVMQLANQEAQRYNHEYIGTEHMLLAIIKEGSGIAANVLERLNIDLRRLRLDVESSMTSGPEMITMGKLPQTPRAKKVIEYAMEESHDLDHSFLGTEHLLLGLMREQESNAANALKRFDLEIDQVRNEILALLGDGTSKASTGKRLRNRERKKALQQRRKGKKSSAAFHKATMSLNDLVSCFPFDTNISLDQAAICKILVGLGKAYGNNVFVVAQPNLFACYNEQIASMVVTRSCPGELESLKFFQVNQDPAQQHFAVI